MQSVKQKLIILLLWSLSVSSYAFSEHWKIENTSENKRYEASLSCSEAPKVGSFQNCWLRLTDQGKSVDNATINIGGGMPKHQHGLPTMPKVLWSPEHKYYQIKGLKFSMPGKWILRFLITFPDNAEQEKLYFSFTI